ncbi:hypothetical protein Ct9H90mP29_02750 [bacterium]|nr:MAG: hypothetical protein Ct9H90mP29_02750 [bacterium]
MRYSSQDGYLYGVREHDIQDHANFFSEIGISKWEGNGDTISMNPSKSLNSLLKLTYKATPRLKFSQNTLALMEKVSPMSLL